MTIWPAVLRRRVPLVTRTERFELPDGDYVDLAWVGDPDPAAPVVAIFHGLEGSIDSGYVRGVLQAIAARGWRGVLMHFRGCSGEPNRLARGYHAGDTGDARVFLAELKRRYPRAPLGAVAYSLGGNMLLKYLGEEGPDSIVDAAIAVSAPMLLSPCAARLQRGFSRVYDRWLLTSLKAHVRRKRDLFVHAVPLDDAVLAKIKTLWDFDEKITGPVHGFLGAEDYYAKSSSLPYLAKIEVPTTILQARDDPFMSDAVIPSEGDLSAAVTLELSEQGGHVGFVSGPIHAPIHWLEQRIPELFAELCRKMDLR
jgi:uncharacterized protein